MQLLQMDSDTDDVDDVDLHPLLLDVHVTVANRRVFSTKHHMSGPAETFSSTINYVLTEYAESIVDIDSNDSDEDDSISDPVLVLVRGFMSRATRINCDGDTRMNLLKFLQRSSNIQTRHLDSTSCPFFKRGLNIVIAREKEKQAPVSGKEKEALPDAVARLNGDSEPKDVLYLQIEVKQNPDFTDQVLEELYRLVQREELGFFSYEQRECLTNNLRDLSVVLSFVEKHWKKLVGSSFPTFPMGVTPTRCYCRLLQIVAGRRRRTKGSRSVFFQHIVVHWQ